MPFWLRFASFWGVKMYPNWAHTPVHVHVQHVHVHVHVHVHGLGCVWARFGTPKAPQKVSKSTPKSAQSGPRSAQISPRAAKSWQKKPKMDRSQKKHFKRYPKASLSFYNPFIISLPLYIYNFLHILLIYGFTHGCYILFTWFVFYFCIVFSICRLICFLMLQPTYQPAICRKWFGKCSTIS